MITGRQIPVCIDTARKLDQVHETLRHIETQLLSGGLIHQASKIGNLAEAVWEESSALEQTVREAYVAARAGNYKL